VRAEDLVGKWWLVRAGGKPPAESFINSMELDFAADGTWKNKIVWQGALAGMTMSGGGAWSLADGVVSFTNGVDKGQSRVTLTSGRLALDPDFTLRKNDGTKAPIAVEYEAAALHKEPVTLRGNAGEVNCVAFSQDGMTLAAGSMDGTIKLMDVPSGN
jgi:WD40 repeat protein